MNLYNKIKNILFFVQKISLNNKNVYIFYLIQKILLFFKLFKLINFVDKFIGQGIYDVLIESSERKCKFISSHVALSELITFMDNNNDQIKKQNKLPHKYIIKSCELGQHKDIHKILYLYYDPDIIFKDNFSNNFENIFKTNGIAYENLSDEITFKIFKGKMIIIKYKMEDILHKHVNFINELVDT